MYYGGYGCDPCYPGYGFPVAGAGIGPVGGYGFPVAGAGIGPVGGCGFGGFALIVVLFILLIIIGASCVGF
ncbi:YjcZ family sporulation protein [Bacillus sp. FJAT-49705]|uniref:YjcZ family sporulation protein n=1 Tax=Cytobacillus citreus TaxID=2833586 RepID=A0ABS5NSU8_9BACI|nr:YjcZ family sporulation protein [Cytobacillus citreus]MBS4190907.1 YjcZ family sporulation protein [Cytobacillus citreus]